MRRLLAAEVTETLPQALKRDPRTDGSYARLKACSTHRLYTRCENGYRRPSWVFFSRFSRLPAIDHLGDRAVVGQRRIATKIGDRLLDCGEPVFAAVFQPLHAEEFALRILGFRDAVGHQQQTVSWLQLQSRGLELRARNQSHGQIAVFELGDRIS